MKKFLLVIVLLLLTFFIFYFKKGVDMFKIKTKFKKIKLTPLSVTLEFFVYNYFGFNFCLSNFTSSIFFEGEKIASVLKNKICLVKGENVIEEEIFPKIDSKTVVNIVNVVGNKDKRSIKIVTSFLLLDFIPIKLQNNIIF